VVGAEHVRANVHVDYDLSTSEDTQETYDPKATAALTLQRSEELMGGTAPAGVPGTASNVPGASGGTAGVVASEQERQSSHSESSTYAVSRNVRRVVQPAGRVQRITAAVLVDDVMESSEQDDKKSTNRRKRTAEEMKEIEQLARAAIGVDAQRGDLLTVENLSFQEFPREKLETPNALERWPRLLQQWSGALRYLGIAALFLIMYFLMLRPIKKQALAAFRQLPGRLARPLKEGAAGNLRAEVPAGAAPPEVPDLPQGTEVAKRAALLKRQLTDKVKTEPAVAGRLVQTWIREANAK